MYQLPCDAVYTNTNIVNTKDIGVFPNPFTHELFIQSNSTNEEAYTLELYSVKGELVKTECLDGGTNLHRIDVSSLKRGIYIVRLISASGRYSEEVIIKE